MRPRDNAIRRLWLCLLGAVAVLTVPAGPELWAQAPGGDGVYYSKQLNFRIPFDTDPNDRRIREVQLYASEDQARSWHLIASAKPGEHYFSVTARKDGWYWFTVRTVDAEGRGYPPNIDQAQARLKVCVDGTAPVVTLRPSQNPAAALSVDWEVRDDNIDLDSLHLEYRLPGTNEWTALGVQKAATGTRAWNPATNAALEVRLQVRDLAGNSNEAVTTVSPSGKPTVGGSANEGGGGKAPDPGAGGGVRVVGSKRISIDYEVSEVGKSGLSVVELWYTRNDGRNWTKYDERTNPQPPYSFEVSEEGLYGSTLVARNNAGGGEQPPKAGDPPQVWVEADLTRPLVRLVGVEVGKGTDLGNLTILWSASDKNLARGPITLSYAEQPAGPWQTIGANEENTGRYVWRMPESVPFKIYVHVEAKDAAENVGTSEPSKPIVVDMAQPKVKVRNVTPGK